MHNEMMTVLQPSVRQINGRARLSLVLVLLLGWGGLSGCKTPPSGGDDSLAWVEIAGHTSTEIKAAAEIVFEKEGYHLTASSPMKFTFEKGGGKMTGLAYGTLISGVLVRVNVTITRQENGNHLLHCEVFMVRNAGDRVLEDVQKRHFGRKPYQELLEKVKASLKTVP